MCYRSALYIIALLVAQLVPGVALGITDNMADLSLEELANLNITSVSKRVTRLSDAAASVFVITAEDIRRTGVRSLPEALRLAPNLQVAQSSASAYSISARGFNSSANKLLVMIDGRSVYTPLYSGVFWDVQDVVLEDVERIEVISGPGATLWGANAVNGVINVITRSAKDSLNGVVSAAAGNRGAETVARYGGTLGEDGYYRVYAKSNDEKTTERANGNKKSDAWYKTQVGFRTDWEIAAERVMLQGNAYDGSESQLNASAVSVSGLNLTGRWEHLLDCGSNLSLQAYFDRTARTVPGVFEEHLDIVDLQVQHSMTLAIKHALSWGLGYRFAQDRVANTSMLAFLPADVNQQWPSVFVQDEISLSQDWQLTLGERLEKNDYTGTESLPNVRLAWKFAPEHMLWTAMSRTIRAPSRLDVDAYFPGNPSLAGGPAFVSEVARVAELGYRGQLSHALTYSVTAFHAEYDQLRTLERSASGTTITLVNGMQGTMNGLEMWGTYRASDRLRFGFGLNTMGENLQLRPGSNDSTAPSIAVGADPKQNWMLRTSFDTAHGGELDCTVRSVAALTAPDVPAYVAVDARYGWRPRKDLELSVTAQNIGASHAESGSVQTRAQLASSVLFKILARF